jgi:hypothetical protein
MHPISFAKKAGAQFVAAWLVTSAMACESPDVIDDCSNDACTRDSSTDQPRKDTPGPPDGTIADSGPLRSLLCGTTGCFPGNWGACGVVLSPLASTAQTSRILDDASDDSDAIVGADGPSDMTVDTTSDAGPSDAQSEECSGDAPHDAVSDSSSQDASSQDSAVDTGAPDAERDATSEPPVVIDASIDGASPPQDAGGSPDGGSPPDATIDIERPDEPKISQSCYIKPAPTGVITECAPVGMGVEGAACDDSHECGALMACVEFEGKRACRPVSCTLPPDCLSGTYYEEAALRANGVTRTDLKIPVCLPVENCTLLAPRNPCPEGKVCAVVGSEGETTCTAPGSAKVGESCDEVSRCSEGLLCSKFSNECVKICHVDSGPIDCPTGTCQGGNRSLPDGFGICVGQIDGG